MRLGPDACLLAIAPERLGQLCEGRGGTARAVDTYRRFTGLLEGCDPELAPRVERARRRIAALEPAAPPAGAPKEVVSGSRAEASRAEAPDARRPTPPEPDGGLPGYLR